MLLCHARLHDEIATVEKARFLERRSFIMTYYVGVDIAKFEHVASILDSKTGELVLDSFHFENSIKGFKELLSNFRRKTRLEIMGIHR